MPFDKTIRILLAEDSEDDIYLMRRALKEQELPYELSVASDGVEAIELLHQKRATNELPKLIVLDVNMPRMDGFEVLDRIKADPDFSKVPVIMLTSSIRDEDIQKSYAMGASSFVSKPSRYQEFRDMIANLTQYWSNVATLP